MDKEPLNTEPTDKMAFTIADESAKDPLEIDKTDLVQVGAYFEEAARLRLGGHEARLHAGQRRLVEDIASAVVGGHLSMEDEGWETLEDNLRDNPNYSK